jgi:hypothetical protein
MKTNKLMGIILFTSLVIMLIGQVFKIQHYPYGELLTFIGISFYIVFSLIEMDRLKKLVQKQSDQK